MGYRDQYNLEPLRIRAMLRTGIVADRWLPLDGILLYQTFRRQSGVQVATIPGEYSGRMQIAILPLGITHPGQKDWYYQCSWAQWSHQVEGKDYWNKRFDSRLADLIDFGGKRGNVTIGSGQYKAYHMPVFYRAALWVEWYCVGDAVEIGLLLTTVTHIGKKGAQGWGRVIKWEITPTPEDWSVWRDDQLMRGIPAEDVVGLGRPFNLAHYGVRPAYWKPNNQKLLAMPETEELKFQL